MPDRCAVPRCGAEVEIVYLDRGLCGHHWDELAAEEPAVMEGPMETKVETVPETEPAAETAATKETAMPSKKIAKKIESKAKPAAKAKAAKEPKPKKEKAPKAEPSGPKPNRVFAIRVTDDELAAIHRAAGPRNATRLIRAVAAAFAAEDEAAFHNVLKEAKAGRG